MILYLHGFRSSPQSAKARLMATQMTEQGRAADLLCPALSVDPAVAIAHCNDLIAQCRAAGRTPTLVGSSLGGYYATWLAEQLDLRAVLINPAVLAHLSLAAYVGRQTYFHSGESFEFTPAYVDSLRQMEVTKPSPERYLLLVEKGDEVLDWRQATQRYAGCEQLVFDGGDHGFTRFAACLPKILDFAGLGRNAVRPLAGGRI